MENMIFLKINGDSVNKVDTSDIKKTSEIILGFRFRSFLIFIGLAFFPMLYSFFVMDIYIGSIVQLIAFALLLVLWDFGDSIRNFINKDLSILEVFKVLMFDFINSLAMSFYVNQKKYRELKKD